ncbi:MAG: cofactor-independent phosphoglycerate mutase [Planctomycetota bacterium]|nr:MAG: cofactor-independent phosphoglycerate mutase [Planctomycetota bacterium]
MKYAIIIPDGCADEPQEAFGGKTPLQAADTPAMDAVAAAGVVGRANHVPDHLPAGSAVANMSLLGYDPVANFTGRAPLEAAAQGIELAADDWAIRCNLVTIENQEMRDFTADHISTDEARQLLGDLQDVVEDEAFQYVPGVSYRNLLLYRGAGRPSPFSNDTRTAPPHDLTDSPVLDDYPRGPGSDLLIQHMNASVKVFADHPVNAARIAAGKLPATNVWLWGQGRSPALAPFAEVYDKRGMMITAVDLLRGIAALLGWERIEVPGATGYTDTDYAAKGRYAVDALPKTDIICVHVEATDEASHEGDAEAKIQALAEIDRHIVAPLHEALKSQGDYRILITPDHPTPLRTKTHSHGAVPLTIAGSDVTADEFTSYDEVTAGASSLSFPEGWKLMRYFLGLS